jgi:predicted TIM-barrel fold metal-dependent hydrolase
MRVGPAGGYDCHVVTCRRTAPRHLERFLSDARPSGAVLVQATDDPGARHSLIQGLASLEAVRGVARLAGHEDSDEIADLAHAGVRGARLDSRAAQAWDARERIARAHELLPAAWHIELGLSSALAARLAPWLAHMDRIFSLALTPDGPLASFGDKSQLRWWLEMGNVYLKVLPAHWTVPALAWLPPLAGCVPDRVVFGSGWPTLDGVPRPCRALEEIVPDANSNAERLYDFASVRPQAAIH